ncbi:MAG TPA: tRNA (adenosine(37)-N6)-threonylcarbamoyltransferase complex ATPase subunit type 1 TsaE [Bacilli bacterium]|nr:tRNA (adenosine(37)-N6)-threonylcarbamoyltransferase complex ATPase subunit type 1 TsaE [Bacilli bacterium]
MKKELIITSSEHMIELGYKIGKKLFPNSIITLTGDLGAGKTTFTKGIGKALSVTDVINSPTFTIMKIHRGRFNLYHMDVYRLNGVGSDFDLEEYFDYGGVCVIEWAEIIQSIIPEEHIQITIKNIDESNRLVELFSNQPIYQRIIEEVIHD